MVESMMDVNSVFNTQGMIVLKKEEALEVEVVAEEVVEEDLEMIVVEAEAEVETGEGRGVGVEAGVVAEGTETEVGTGMEEETGAETEMGEETGAEIVMEEEIGAETGVGIEIGGGRGAILVMLIGEMTGDVAIVQTVLTTQEIKRSIKIKNKIIVRLV